MDVLTKAQRSRNMRAIKGKETRIEIKLAKALWAKGYRYRKNNKTVFGKPDLTFKKFKVAVFVDSEYWHGKDWDKQKFRIKTNRKFWWNKIESNIRRDKIVNKELKRLDWKIIRFWGDQIDKKLELCIFKIEEELRKRQQWRNTPRSERS